MNATPPAKVAASMARTTGRTSRVMLCAQNGRVRRAVPRPDVETLSARGGRLRARRRAGRASSAGCWALPGIVGSTPAHRPSKPFRQRFVSSAGRSRRSSPSQTAPRSRLARGRRGSVAGSRYTDRRSLGRRPAVRWGRSVGGGTRLPRRRCRRRPVGRISCSRAVFAPLGSDRLSGECGLRWCQAGRDRPLFPLQADVYARIAL